MIIILNTTLRKSISVKPSKTGLCIALLCYEKSSSKKNVFVALKLSILTINRILKNALMDS